MCTSISFTQPPLYGRTLDLEESFGQQVAITPREYPFTFHHCPPLPRHHAMVGMASVARGVPLYAEAMNEHGLYMAGLNFPHSAHYFPDQKAQRSAVAPYELIPLVLGTCTTLAQARQLLEQVRLTAIPFAPDCPLAPLHWHVADPSGALTAEPREDGLRLFENPVGVLTNEPPFPYHLMNLNNYQALSPQPPENRFAPALELRCYGQGMGALGLPGDASPMSRFVRAAFHRNCAAFPEETGAQVVEFFRLLDTVAMPRGSVITPQGKYDQTLYACCADGRSLTYYYKTHDSGRICAVPMDEPRRTGSALLTFPLVHQPDFLFPEPRQE